MFTIEVKDINELLFEACNKVMSYGEKVTVREQETRELHPFHATIEEPLKRTLLYPYRGNNPFATLFETVWVLGALDNDITELAKYIPRAYDFSDDGKRWRAGYPERIRNYGIRESNHMWNSVDQFQYVYEKLKADSESRQAVINLWNPLLDDFNEDENLLQSKDYPCSQNLTFLIRNGKLDCTFYIRSNDAIFGCTAINLYEFTVMQEILAGLLGVEMGTFYYYINSLHIYSRHYDKAKVLMTDGMSYRDLLDGADFDNYVTNYNIPVFRFYDNRYETYKEHMDMCEHLYHSIIDPKEPDCPEDEYTMFSDIRKLCDIYMEYKDKEFSVDTWADYTADMQEVSLSDLKVACHFWMSKKFGCIAKDAIEVCIQQMVSMEEGRK